MSAQRAGTSGRGTGGNMVRGVVQAVAAVAAAGAGMLGVAGPAAASSCGTSWQCPAVLTDQAPWTPQIKPTVLYTGQGGAPYLTGLSWSSYGHGGAAGRGILHAERSGCTPSARCVYYTHPVTVTMSGTQLHGRGEYYYSRMRWAYTAANAQAQHSWKVRGGYWR